MKRNDNLIQKEHQDKLMAINELLEKKYPEEPVVLMAPKMGSTKNGEENTKVRMYAYGGLIAELATKGRQQDIYMPDKTYYENEKYRRLFQREEICEGKEHYKSLSVEMIADDQFSEFLGKCITIAKNRARTINQEKDENSERCVETKLIRFYRDHEDYTIIDMEMLLPMQLPGKRMGAKPDLVVLDKKRKAFGFIELKVCNKSTANLKRHLEDFVKVNQPENAGKAKGELKRKIGYLTSLGLIKYADEIVADAMENEIWSAFLFIGGDVNESRELVRNMHKGMSKEMSEEMPEVIANCRFKYCDEKVIRPKDSKGINLSYDAMESYEDFVKDARR